MSYILDALRRADAERERERSAAPGLHAQPAPASGMPEPHEGAPRQGRSLLLAGVLGLLVIVAAALAWWWLGHAAEPAAVPIAAAPAPAPVVTPPSPQAMSAGTASSQPLVEPPRLVPLPAILPDPQPAPVSQRAGAPPIQPQVPSDSVADGARGTTTATPTAEATLPLSQRGAGRANPAPPVEAASRAASVLPSPSVAAPGPAPRLPTLRELPDRLRRELPAMAVAGSMYSPEPASRMLVIDGQVLREGQPLQPDLLLEQIGPKSAVFSWRGQRFELPF